MYSLNTVNYILLSSVYIQKGPTAGYGAEMTASTSTTFCYQAELQLPSCHRFRVAKLSCDGNTQPVGW